MLCVVCVCVCCGRTLIHFLEIGELLLKELNILYAISFSSFCVILII